MSEELNSSEVVGKELDFHARLGQPLPKGASIATESMVVEALKTVQDPEPYNFAFGPGSNCQSLLLQQRVCRSYSYPIFKLTLSNYCSFVLFSV